MQIAKEKKTGKQTQKEKKSFFQVDVIWLAPHVQNTLSLVGTGYPRFFSLFFETCSAFH